MTWFRKHLSLFLLTPAFFSPTAYAATRTAADCTASSVGAQVTASSPGDTVVVPAGTCSWSGSSLTISGITLQGAGLDANTGTIITAGTIAVKKHASQTTRLTGFRFTGTDVHAVVTGSASARAYIIDHNYFFAGQNDFFDLNANGGLVHHNTFFMNPSQGGGPDVMMIHPDEDWSQPTTFGNADTQGPQGGERNLYFEDNTFTNVLETAPDGDQGGRLVIRHNTYVDSSIVFHAGGPVNDTSSHGTRQFEVYSNTFSRVNCNNNMNKWIWVRGGSGVIANNTMDQVSTSCFGGKTQISISVGCNSSSSWPIQHQIGQTVEPQASPTQPLLIFGNTGAGASGGSFLTLSGANGGGITCSSPSTFVQQNRDYYLSNQWGWTPFTYPHPLAQASGGGGSSSNPPVAPTGLQAVVN